MVEADLASAHMLYFGSGRGDALPCSFSMTGTPTATAGFCMGGSCHDVEKLSDDWHGVSVCRGVVCSGHCRR